MYVYKYVYVYLYVCMYVYTYICMYMCICMYVCMYVCMQVRTRLTQLYISEYPSLKVQQSILQCLFQPTTLPSSNYGNTLCHLDKYQSRVLQTVGLLKKHHTFFN
jgi:nuclear pore complex protein Nup62